MAQRFTRRDFGKRAAGIAATLAAGPLALAQEVKPEDKPPVSDAEIDEVAKKLAKPLSSEARKILRDDLSQQKTDTKKRLEVKLPENSEPCFTFIPTPKAEGREDKR